MAERQLTFANENLHDHPVWFLGNREVELLLRFLNLSCVVIRFAQAESRQFVIGILLQQFFVARDSFVHWERLVMDGLEITQKIALRI